jgi:bifunctional non-homologous end joining protein LigD
MDAPTDFVPSSRKVKASFIRPMLLLRTDKLPDDRNVWQYQVKLDGFRSSAFKSSGKVYLRSRNHKDFADKYPTIKEALKALPDETVLDGEVVAIDDAGRPSFNALQNYGSDGRSHHLVYYVFDVMVVSGANVMREPLVHRREILERKIAQKMIEPVRLAPELDAELPDLIRLLKQHGLEGLVAKRRDSRYEPGVRSGAWRKMRLNRSQDFVIGGYTLGNPFDALVFGFYEGRQLIYAARTRNGFTTAMRAELFHKFRGLETLNCPFVNLPEERNGRWGQGLTKDKMADCRWLKPLLVGCFEFVEWTPDNHLRHTRFMELRVDRKPTSVKREPE